VSDLLALYDQHERFAASFPDLRREAVPNLVRHVDLVGHSSTVLYSQLSAENAEGAIDDQIAYFQSLGHEFEWKVFGHDEPVDLVQRLAAHGFKIDETEAIMVLDMDNAPAALLAPTPNVRRLRQLDDLRDVSAIRHQVRGDPDVTRLAFEMEHTPEYLSVYVAYAENIPAACGWIRFLQASAFASLWGGSTLPEWRRKGIYRALVGRRAVQARDRGFRYVQVDASPDSRPILERLGLTVLTGTTPYTWTP